MTTILDRPNRYAATCVRCGNRIAAEAGLLARRPDGTWAADHHGECPTAPAPAAATHLGITEDGMYRTADGTIYKVQHAVHGSGRLYAKRLQVTDHGDGEPATVTFDYAPGAVHTLTPDDRMTLDQARAFGALYGTCIRCGRTLTDDDSIAAGIGPICAGKI